ARAPSVPPSLHDALPICACHNTTLSVSQFCGDYAGYAQLDLEKQLPGTQAMFVMGAGGDQNPYPRREIPLAEQHGASLAAAVARDRKSTRLNSSHVKISY